MGSAWAGPKIIDGCRSGPCCIQEAGSRAAAPRQAAQITSQLHSRFSAKPFGVMSMPEHARHTLPFELRHKAAMALPEGGDRPDATAPTNSLVREVWKLQNQAANHADNEYV